MEGIKVQIALPDPKSEKRLNVLPDVINTLFEQVTNNLTRLNNDDRLFILRLTQKEMGPQVKGSITEDAPLVDLLIVFMEVAIAATATRKVSSKIKEEASVCKPRSRKRVPVERTPCEKSVAYVPTISRVRVPEEVSWHKNPNIPVLIYVASDDDIKMEVKSDIKVEVKTT